MNGNDLVALVFICLFGAVCGWSGYLLARRNFFEAGYRAGAADTSKTLFKTAVRAASSKADNAGQRRWSPLPPFRARGRAKAPSIHDDTTVGISRTTMRTDPGSGSAGTDDEDTVVVAFQRRGEAA